MPTRCTVCTHDSRQEIDRALLAGVSYRTLAAQNGLSPSALCRHTRHLARYLDAMRRREDLNFQQVILEKLDLAEVRLGRLFHTAQDHRSLRVAMDCIKEYVKVLALQEKFRIRTGDPP